MRKLFALGALLVAAAASNGCISNTMYGCEITETLAPGASEGEVVMKHGAPDNIVYLGAQYMNPQTGERGDHLRDHPRRTGHVREPESLLVIDPEQPVRVVTCCRCRPRRWPPMPSRPSWRLGWTTCSSRGTGSTGR